ncbi:DnaJ family molecular chaperone [Rhodoferax sp. OV413]|uniref:J domain-containing protein n=1 Tax=Rhodoferax sp. OV413 TaxID=1855285 RepID=UPI000B857A4F|nr:DnaJ domain-containing protein [Rhodoferax sp. OV413]
MSGMEIGVIVGGLVFGYWLVSFFTAKSPPKPMPEYVDFRNEALSDQMPAQAQAAPCTAAWYAVLEVAPTASADEIRAAYRRLISLYHPDKVTTLGPELQALAEQKSQQIGAAYRTGMQLRGVSA